MVLLWEQMEGLRTYTLATDYTGNSIVTQHYMCMHMHTLFEQHLSRNEMSIKGKMHWKSRHIRICLAPNFCEFISTGLKKSFPLQIVYNEKKFLKCQIISL